MFVEILVCRLRGSDTNLISKDSLTFKLKFVGDRLSGRYAVLAPTTAMHPNPQSLHNTVPIYVWSYMNIINYLY